MTGRNIRAVRLAWSLCAASLLLIALGLLLTFLGWSAPLPAGWAFSWQGQAILSTGFIGIPILGGLIASRRPNNPYGWLWLALGISGPLATFAPVYAAYALVAEPGSLPAPQMVGTLVAGAGWIVSTALFPFLLLLFPTGRVPSRRWRLLAWAVVAAGATALFTLPLATLEDSFVPGGNPIGLGGTAGGVITVLAFTAVIVILAAIVLSALSLVFRYRRAGGVERQQIKCFAYAAVVFGAGLVFSGFLGKDLPGVWDALFEVVTLSGLYVAVGIAIFRYRLYDIDLIINRTLVYGTLTACVVALYVLVVGYLGAVFRTEDTLLISLLATGLVAVLFQPLRERLQRAVNKLMYGDRDEPYAVLSRLGERLEGALAPEAILPTIVRTVREALKLPYAAIMLREGDEFVMAAESGASSDAPLRLPLVYGRETVGELLLASRSPGEELTPADRHLLEDLARLRRASPCMPCA